MDKKCTECNETLPISSFRIKSGRPGQAKRYSSKCKSCLNRLARAKYWEAKAKKPKPKLKPKPTKPGHKTCTRCGHTLPLEKFHKCCKNPTKNWHYDSKCKVCKAATAKKKREYIRPSAKLLEHRLLESKRKKVSNGKHRHGSKLIDFTIGVEDVRAAISKQTRYDKLHCAALGTALDEDHPLLKPSIDRIDNRFGYTPTNIRITSVFYNLGRNRWDDVTVARAIYGLVPGAKNFDRFIKRDTQSKQWHSKNGLYTNPGKTKSIPIYDYDVAEIARRQTSDGYLCCAATGLRLTNSRWGPLYPSVDRVSPSGGYTNSNVVITAAFFNLARNRAGWGPAKEVFEHISKRGRLIFLCGKYFFEDELRDKEHICRALLRQVSETTVRASDCRIKEVDNRLAGRFFDSFHYAGSVANSVNLALVYCDEMVACMGFRRPSGINSKEDWELSRMARHASFHIHGGWSRLWKHARNLLNGSIVTFSDNRLFSGETYELLGFSKVRDIPPSHYWWRDGVRYHRQTTRRPKGCELSDSEYMHSLGYERVMDLGKKKWVS